MAKMLSQNDWNFNNIGTKFELDEVIPKFETEVRADANGEIIKNRDGSERRFNTDKIIGWKYNVTIKDGQFKKKSTQVSVDNPDDVSKLTYEDIYQFREHLRDKNAQNSEKKLSPNTINKIIILLKKILDVGLRKGYYKEHPAGLLKKLQIEKAKLNFWTVKEFKHFLTLFNDDEYNIKLLFTVLFLTGLRLGEALALTWKDIEFSTNTIHVSKSVYVKKGEEHISSTKTKAGTRRIIMNNKLVETLEEWKQTQHGKLKEFTSNLDDLQIFQNSPITITKDSIEKQYKKILQRDNTLKKIRIHDFRHSHASLLINQGEDYLVVKERLGHASITTTIDTYSHLYPSKQQKIADKLDDLL